MSKEYRPVQSQPNPINSLPLVGWALIIGSFATFVYTVFPIHWLDSEWKIGCVGQLVDNSLLPLLGFSLVCFGQSVVVTQLKLIGLRIIIVAALLLGILYLAIIPLALRDMQRLDERLGRQLIAAQSLQNQQIGKVQSTLAKASTVQELQVVGVMLNIAPPPSQESKALEFDEELRWLQSKIQSKKKEQIGDAKELFDRKHAQLEKDALKIYVGALLAAVCYFILFASHRGIFRKYELLPARPASVA